MRLYLKATLLCLDADCEPRLWQYLHSRRRPLSVRTAPHHLALCRLRDNLLAPFGAAPDPSVLAGDSSAAAPNLLWAGALPASPPSLPARLRAVLRAKSADAGVSMPRRTQSQDQGLSAAQAHAPADSPALSDGGEQSTQADQVVGKQKKSNRYPSLKKSRHVATVRIMISPYGIIPKVMFFHNALYTL